MQKNTERPQSGEKVNDTETPTEKRAKKTGQEVVNAAKKTGDRADEFLNSLDEILGDEGDTQNKTNDPGNNSLLDQIDDVLEINAEQFVKNYTQRGGQ